ncbi:hypothetical protein MPLSOD_190029 [Mesorhizobium sp. SOD10]|nr:hypothetical protein MPLSOD_190029 [Mesorhizobium sp. SOD10]
MCSKAGTVRGIAAVFFLRLNGIHSSRHGGWLRMPEASVAACGRQMKEASLHPGSAWINR